MKYIIDNRFSLCGWKKLPFAIMDSAVNKPVFFDRHEFEFLFDLNGKKDIDEDSLSERDKLFLDALVKHGIVRKAENGETRNLFYKEYKGVYKRDVQWSITGLCNYRCRHCFQSAPEGVLGHPTLSQCLEIIRQLDECGIKGVAITGGEPLIRDDFFAIVDALTEHRIDISTIYTNGKLVTNELLDGLCSRNLHPSFQISFDGVGHHDWMRGVEGAEKIALDAFRLLHARGFKTVSAMCLCRENIGSIRDTVNTLASVGCLSLKFQRTMPQGEWCNEPEHTLTVEETVKAYLDYLPQFKEDGCPMTIQMEGFFLYDKSEGHYLCPSDKTLREEDLEKAPPCGVIQNSLYIGPNGAVTPCMSMCGAEIEKQFPNVFETKLEDILTDSSFTRLTSRSCAFILDHNEKCRDCSYRSRCCGGCRAMATGQNGGDYFAVDPIMCEMYTGGWIDRMYETADKLFKRAGTKSEIQEC